MKSDTIIISIHPVFVEKILSGEKKYEFRKYFPAGVRYMLVYTTSPVKKITAIVEIDTVLCDSPRNIWSKTRKQAGITKRFYDTYFKDKGIKTVDSIIVTHFDNDHYNGIQYLIEKNLIGVPPPAGL